MYFISLTMTLKFLFRNFPNESLNFEKFIKNYDDIILEFFLLAIVRTQQISSPLLPRSVSSSVLPRKGGGSTRFLSKPIFLLLLSPPPRSSPLTRLVDARGLASQSVCATLIYAKSSCGVSSRCWWRWWVPSPDMEIPWLAWNQR